MKIYMEIYIKETSFFDFAYYDSLGGGLGMRPNHSPSAIPSMTIFIDLINFCLCNKLLMPILFFSASPSSYGEEGVVTNHPQNVGSAANCFMDKAEG